MPSNVEIKARLRDPGQVAEVAQRLAGAEPRLIVQHDFFYSVDTGRLKLRCFPDGSGELIAYGRPDTAGPKISCYHLFRTDDAEALATVLSASLAPAGEVRKERRLFLVGRTRIHLDRVEGLGDFLELEVVLGEGESSAEGDAEARELMDQLGILDSDLVEGAYVDHLEGI